MVDFIVGMCNHDGAEKRLGRNDFDTKDVLTRFQRLRAAVVQAFGATLDPAKLYCFVAPEFFFGNVALPKTEFRKLVDACKSFYSASNLILVPGSMVTYSGSDKKAKKTDFLNRVPILYGGQFLEHDKHGGAGEAGMNAVGQFRQGTTDGEFRLQFGANRYTFGIEVCVDHRSGVLKDQGGRYDVHIVTANTVDYVPENARATHYLLHCNANQGSRAAGSSMRVYRGDGTQVDPTSKPAANEVHVWNLTL